MLRSDAALSGYVGDGVEDVTYHVHGRHPRATTGRVAHLLLPIVARNERRAVRYVQTFRAILTSLMLLESALHNEYEAVFPRRAGGEPVRKGSK